MSIKTIFLDRDGVINKETNYLHQIDKFEFIEGIFEACDYFIKLKYKIIIVTNQSGIGRGYYSDKDFQVLTQWINAKFLKKNIDILDVFYCPHTPKDKCKCRKPMPGMFLKAMNKHDIDMTNSWAIGDKEADIVAANKSGISNTVLVRSGHKINETDSNAKYILDSILQSINIIS
jgi:D-glycero-D-manno-heptose 1,7-bisphosphate phosphatase